MAQTPSTMIPLGTPAPNFSLLNVVTGQINSFTQLKSERATVIMFICNHCPFVKHVQAELIHLAHDYQSKGVAFIAISANDADKYPQDGPKAMREVAEEWAFPFPYLYDETQIVAQAYEAACTPDFFVFDGQAKCAYRGQLDDSRPGTDQPVTGRDLRAALDAVLASEPVPEPQKPSIGCNIKWKAA